MIEQQATHTVKKETPAKTIFPLDEKTISDFFSHPDLKDLDPVKYKEVFQDRIGLIEGENPDLYEVININSDHFKDHFLNTNKRNYYLTGAYICYNILCLETETRGIEIPLFEDSDFKMTNSINTNKVSDMTGHQLLGAKEKRITQYEDAKRKKIIYDLNLLKKDEPLLFSRLNIPQNPSLISGAAFVYSQFRKKFELANNSA